MLTLPGTTLAGGGSGSGSGGSGGGTVTTVIAGSAVAAIPQVAGEWRGSYSYQVLGVGVVAPPNNHEVITFLNQAKDKLTGTFCLGAVSPGCFIVKGDLKAPTSVTIQFDAIATPFALRGNVAPMFCVDGTPGKVISGGFTVREGSGGFSFNNCPPVSLPVPVAPPVALVPVAPPVDPVAIAPPPVDPVPVAPPVDPVPVAPPVDPVAIAPPPVDPVPVAQ